MTWHGQIVVVVVVIASVVGASGCDVRGNLAQLATFAGLRPGLVDQCCTCLAARGTGDDPECPFRPALETLRAS